MTRGWVNDDIMFALLAVRNNRYRVKRFIFNWMEHFFLPNLCWIKYWANHNAFRDCRSMQRCQNGQNKAFSSLLHCQWCFQGRKLNRIWKRAAALASSSSTWHCSLNPFITISRSMQMLDTNNKPSFKAQPIHNASSWSRNKENVQFAWENVFFNKSAASTPEDNRSLLSASVLVHLCAQNNTNAVAKWWKIELQTCFCAQFFCHVIQFISR